MRRGEHTERGGSVRSRVVQPGKWSIGKGWLMDSCCLGRYREHGARSFSELQGERKSHGGKFHSGTMIPTVHVGKPRSKTWGDAAISTLQESQNLTGF